MESVYWVLSWACHRRCTHCYDDRFRPYVRGALDQVLTEGEQAWAGVIANLPDDFGYLDQDGARQPGRLILAGGEVLLEGFRQRIFYPVLEAVQTRWTPDLRPKIHIQTTGDRLNETHLEAMLSRGVSGIAISGFDSYHVGMTDARQAKLAEKIDAMMARMGVSQVKLGAGKSPPVEGPTYLYFGAEPGRWIGELWPRGRAWTNDLSTADWNTNFCARHSGARSFLDYRAVGSEVAIEPNGDVFPCCLKTGAPIGNLTEEPLLEILDGLRGHPAFEALNRGDPGEAGETLGIDRDSFRKLSQTLTPKGRPYENPCIGCDRLFEQQLAAIAADLRSQRQMRRLQSA
ncbi:MAG: SPASM domain-containing protein [Caulobacter sp.]|nr:SPASM domain-containing protein [Caulobacter sp.]